MTVTNRVQTISRIDFHKIGPLSEEEIEALREKMDEQREETAKYWPKISAEIQKTKSPTN